MPCLGGQERGSNSGSLLLSPRRFSWHWQVDKGDFLAEHSYTLLVNSLFMGFQQIPRVLCVNVACSHTCVYSQGLLFVLVFESLEQKTLLEHKTHR